MDHVNSESSIYLTQKSANNDLLVFLIIVFIFQYININIICKNYANLLYSEKIITFLIKYIYLLNY